MLRLISALALIVGLASSPARAADELAQVNQDWAAAWEAGDLDAVLALYTKDAVFHDADGSRVIGRHALREFFANVLKQYSAKPTMWSVVDGSSGDLGYDSGTYSEVVTPVGNPAGAIQTHGSYLVILRRVEGHWRIAQQMWTGSTPVPVKK